MEIGGITLIQKLKPTQRKVSTSEGVNFELIRISFKTNRPDESF